MTERLAPKFGRWWTPVLIGLMYMVHEMTNPEYWYEGMFFPIIFIGVAIFAMIYLWRRSVVVIWLGDGLGRFLINLF
jgi:Na+-transporting NADH:ubiquinone oxidoreductase subunit NqrB